MGIDGINGNRSHPADQIEYVECVVGRKRVPVPVIYGDLFTEMDSCIELFAPRPDSAEIDNYFDRTLTSLLF